MDRVGWKGWKGLTRTFSAERNAIALAKLFLTNVETGKETRLQAGDVEGADGVIAAKDLGSLFCVLPSSLVWLGLEWSGVLVMWLSYFKGNTREEIVESLPLFTKFSPIFFTIVHISSV